MTTYYKLLVHGSPYLDAENVKVIKNMGVSNATSSCVLNFYNTAGRRKSEFEINDEIQVYSDNDDPAVTKIFDGYVKNIEYDAEGYTERLTVEGADYSEKLTSFTIEPMTYISKTIGSIVTDIISVYTEGISYSGIQPCDVLIDKVTFNHTPVFDAIKQLADQAEYIFYVDENKDFHFEPAGSISSGYTFNSTNVREAKFTTSDQEIGNDLWVYGAPSYYNWNEQFSPTGSVYTLTYKPHNTEVTSAGSIQRGAIQPTVNADYFVDYDRQQIIFISGTIFGDHIPSGSPILIKYDVEVPLYVRDQDYDSIQSYGRRPKVIKDEDIKDTAMAYQVLNANMELYKDPITEGTLKINGIQTITPGNTCIVNLPNHNISSQTYDIVDAEYDFTQENCLSDNVLTIRVSRHIKDIVDTLKNILLSIRKLEGNQITEGVLSSRDKFFPGSAGAEVNIWELKTQSIGSAFVMSHPRNGKIGSYATHTMGNWMGELTIVRSGGTY